MKWYKQDGNSDSNPKIRRAGYWGARTFEALCRISADFELEGKIPGHYADPSYLADRTMANQILPPEEAERAVAAGLERIATADPKWALVSIDEDGTVTILGWRGEGKDTDALSSTERSRNLRALQEARKEIERLAAMVGELQPPEQRAATPSNEAATNATPSNAPQREETVAPPATNATNATLEEKREEEIREDPPLHPPAAAGGARSPPAGKARRKGKRSDGAEPSEVGARVLARLNELGGGAYRYSPQLEARVAEGVPEADLIAVVDHQARRGFMRENPEYYRPKTLFGTDNFREYLATARATGAPPGPPVRLVGGLAPSPPQPELGPPTVGEHRLFPCGACRTIVLHRWDGDWTVAYHKRCPSPASTSAEARAIDEEYRATEARAMAALEAEDAMRAGVAP